MISFADLDVTPTTSLETVLERLYALYPKAVDLSLGRLRRLLTDLGNPQDALPPTIHVAGTNGKGSTCAFIRSIAERAGWPMHLYTSPHLVSFNERYRVAGELADDATLFDALRQIETVNNGQPLTAFEAITAAAFVLFAQTPAKLCVIEVGLGGRFDATNVIESPIACAIASISLDHAEFLGTDIRGIAREKAGIIKHGRPVITGRQTEDVLAVLRDEAAQADAPFLARDEAWDIEQEADGVRYRDAQGSLMLPTPRLPGDHQLDNAGIAIATLRHSGVGLPDFAFAGIDAAEWPARMQRLQGALARQVPAHELWLDGGHNPGAADMLSRFLGRWRDKPLYLVVGMKQSKDLANFLSPLLGLPDRLFAVAEPGQFQAVSAPEIIAASGGKAEAGPDVRGALAQLAGAPPGRVLICGSLYLAGEVLKLDQTD